MSFLRSGPEGVQGTRVLVTCDAVGGVWTYALDLARGLSTAGVAITLAVLGPLPTPDQVDEAEAVADLDLISTGLPLDWMAESPEQVRGAGRALAALTHEVRADLVHLHSPALAAGISFPAPMLASCHSCVKTWWQAARGTELPADFAWRAELVRQGCDAADALIAPTHAFARATTQAYGLGREPIVVHNGRAAVPPDAAMSGNAPVVAFTAGRLWDEGKNVSMLDEAASFASVPVLAAGPTNGPNGARIGFHHLHSLGRLAPDELDARFARRPIFVSPALYEPFGLSVLEAAQRHCPLVLSDTPTFRELWDGAALFIDARDARALAGVLDRLAADARERERLGRAAARRAERYDLARMVEGTVRAYRSVIGRRAVRGGDAKRSRPLTHASVTP